MDAIPYIVGGSITVSLTGSDAVPSPRNPDATDTPAQAGESEQRATGTNANPIRPTNECS